MKKILILANESGGLYRFRGELLEELVKHAEVVVSTPCLGKVDEIKSCGCRIIETDVDRRGMNPIKDLRLFLEYIRIIKKEKPDRILSYTIKPNMYGGLAARILKVPFYPYVAGLGTPFQKENLVSKILILAHRIAFFKSPSVFFENAETMEFYKKHSIVNTNTIKIPGAGVNLQYFRYMPMPEIDHTEFVFIGRIMKEKGVDELFSTAQRLKEKYPSVVINMVGPYEENYEKTVDELSDKRIIKFWGFQDDVKPIVYGSHCLVLPSYHEGMANVLLEAAAMGRILITSDIHGCKEAVEDGKNGYLVPVRDSSKLYEAMESIVLANQKQKDNMGKYSRRIVERDFNREIVVNTTIDTLLR